MNKAMIAGILAVLLVLGTIVSVILFARTQPLIPIMFVGAVLAYLGTMGIFASDGMFTQKLPLLIFPIVGCAMIAVPAVMLYQKSHPGMVLITEEQLPKLLLIALFLGGVCICIGAVFKIVHTAQHETDNVEQVMLIIRHGGLLIMGLVISVICLISFIMI